MHISESSAKKCESQSTVKIAQEERVAEKNLCGCFQLKHCKEEDKIKENEE